MASLNVIVGDSGFITDGSSAEVISAGSNVVIITVTSPSKRLDYTLKLYGNFKADSSTQFVPTQVIYSKTGCDAELGSMDVTLAITGVGQKFVVADLWSELLAGDDWVVLGDGADTLAAGAGADFVDGGRGTDQLSGGKGDDVIDGGDDIDTNTYVGLRNEYSVAPRGASLVVTDSIADRDGTDTVLNVERIHFSDMVVNLTVQAKAASVTTTQLHQMEELYVAFFNRVPDADGLSYWIDQFKGGQSFNAIAESFYNAGVQYSNLTGFSTTMSNQDFINVVYKNVLGRSGGADQGGLGYWSGELTSGRASHGSLVSDILNSAHTFKGDATYGWVADLLDNKIAVANKFAVDLGLSYNSANDSITNGMAIAAAVTASSTTAAIALIGISGI